MRRTQARCKNVVKVIVKFIKAKGKTPQRKQWWALERWDRSPGLCYKGPL
jgi:hypothetical protein